MRQKQGLWKKLLVLPAVILGVIILVLVVKNKKAPEMVKVHERVRAVRVVAAPEVAVVPRAIGYGVVEPSVQWDAVAEVGGKVVEVHPELKKGAILPRGAVLFKIDPQEYGLATQKSVADVENLKAMLEEIERREHNLKRSLLVEKRALEIAAKELERQRILEKKGTVAASEVDIEERNYLLQKQKVQDIENSLHLIPAERLSLQAQLTSGTSTLENVKLDEGKTVITTPFACRISEVNAELQQYVPPQFTLAKAYDIESVEIPAQVPILKFKTLLPRGMRAPDFFQEVTMDKIRRMLGISVEVRLAGADELEPWTARFERVGEELDPKTRTVIAYVKVENPYNKVLPGVRPPLLKNMYCEVEFRGRPQPETVIVPRVALHGENTVYICNAEKRLERRKVRISDRLGSFLSLQEGVASGELVVVSDLAPAIEGMLLAPQPDEELEGHIVDQATGKGPLK